MNGSRAKELRKKMKDIEKTDFEKVNKSQSQMIQMIVGLAGRIYQMEKKVQLLNLLTEKIDYRTLAMMMQLDDKSIVANAEKLQIEDFDKKSAQEDKDKNLVDTVDSADKGMFAVVTLKIYKDGKELEEERIIRSKFEIGKNEIFAELDDSIVGMKVGEIKRFPLNLMGQTDEAEIILLALKKRIIENKTE